jgi:hypothetical protein
MNSKSLATLQEAAREDNPALSKAGFNPTSMSEAISIANLYIASGLTAFKRSSEAVVAIEHGMSLGMSPAQSMQSIAIINGKPGIYGDAALALVKSTGMLKAHSETFTGTLKDGTRACTCKVVRIQKLANGEWNEVEYEQTFGIAEAKDAKLWGKSGPWTQYPDRMMKMRARGFCLRDAFPDILKGVGIAEELQDIPGRKPAESTAPAEINGSRAAGLGATLASRVSPEPQQAEESPESDEDRYIDTEAAEAAETQESEPSDAEQPRDDDWDDSLLDELPG